MTDVAVLMADYNLITIPVVDDQCRMLGLITVDDVLEATLPEDWRRREAAMPPDARHGETAQRELVIRVRRRTGTQGWNPRHPSARKIQAAARPGPRQPKAPDRQARRASPAGTAEANPRDSARAGSRDCQDEPGGAERRAR